MGTIRPSAIETSTKIRWIGEEEDGSGTEIYVKIVKKKKLTGN